MKKIIAGNWKMNKNAAEAAEFVAALTTLDATKATVIACVPFTDLTAAVSAAKGSDIHIGAQNVHWAESGAFTGEISASMLNEAGCEYVIIGHSERRQYFGETDETVRMRLKAALAANLKPIVCVGETLAERESDRTQAVLKTQITGAFAGITPEELSRVIIAYEPVWAIGTGKTATADDANNVAAYIRSLFEAMYSASLSKKLPILYGGSMNDKNAPELLAMPHIDGGLIGGASLVKEKFAAIIAAAH